MFVTSIVIFCNCIAKMKYRPNKYSVPAFGSICVEFGSNFCFWWIPVPFFPALPCCVITNAKWELSWRSEGTQESSCLVLNAPSGMPVPMLVQPAAGLFVFPLSCSPLRCSSTGGALPEALRSRAYCSAVQTAPCQRGNVCAETPLALDSSKRVVNLPSGLIWNACRGRDGGCGSFLVPGFQVWAPIRVTAPGEVPRFTRICSFPF